MRLADGATVLADPDLRPAARWWRHVTEEAFGIDLVPVAGPAADVVLALDESLAAGGYRLEVGAETHGAAVRIAAADLAGAHAAAQTLRQLAGPDAYRRASTARSGAAAAPTLPAVRIEDHPRFEWRGVLLDVARHFLPKHDVLRFVDLAAAHRLNVLQLHLTDDQGWRVQVHRYPELTRTGAWRRESTVGTWRTGSRDGRPHGGFYTQDDLREIVAYARDRGITVVPEIDVPGHVEAAVAAYPELGTRKARQEVRTTWGISQDVLDPSEGSLAFFRHVLDEVLDVFDTPGSAWAATRYRPRSGATRPGSSTAPARSACSPRTASPTSPSSTAGSSPGSPGTCPTPAAAPSSGTRPSHPCCPATSSSRPGAGTPRAPRRSRPGTTWSWRPSRPSISTTARATTPRSRSRSASCARSRTCTASTRSRPR
nr:hypothetical protein GCM10025730_18180 [Promicromonospora thailandica]